MATTVFETYGVVRPDGTLELEQKLSGLPGRVKVRVESMDVPDVELAKRFAELTATCDHDTRYSSKLKNKVEHPAFREIVAMGEKAVPLLLACLEKKEASRWTMTLALNEITGADPVLEESAGKLEKIAAAWIIWGRDQGYRW